MIPIVAMLGKTLLTAGMSYIASRASNLKQEALGNGGPQAPTSVGLLSSLSGFGLKLNLASEGLSKLSSIPNTVSNWSKSLLDSQQQIVQYNGAMRMSSLYLSTQRTARDIKQGQLTSDSYSSLNQSQNRLERANLPFKIAKQNIENKKAAIANNRTAEQLEALAKSSVGKAILKMGDAADKNNTQEPFLNSIALSLAQKNGSQRAAPAQKRGQF